MKTTDPIVIVSAKRTPLGAMLGQFVNVSAAQLGACAIKAACELDTLPADSIDEVYMGCVLTAGQGQAPARQAAHFAGLANSVPCTTVNKMCGSGLQALIIAHDRIQAGSAEVVIAGGQENMSQAPYLVSKARAGYRFGHGQLYDHMLLDGLEDAYPPGKPMGCFAEQTASEFGFTRMVQDTYARESLTRAQNAIQQGVFADEIAPVNVSTRQGNVVIETDECPGRVKVEKIPSLPPAFVEGGTVTAANASAISDGAAALCVMRESMANRLQLAPLARIVGHFGIAKAPAWFTTAPADSIQGLLAKIGWRISDVDCYEINEAFAVVALHAMQSCGLARDNVNMRGGACALGHPIGASGARIVVTLLHTLKQQQLKRGVASLCIGGGEAIAIALACY